MVHDASRIETLLYQALTRFTRTFRVRSKQHPWPRRTLTLGTVLETHGFLPEGTPLKWTPNQRARHLFCLGGSGCGKSYWLASLMLQDLEHENPFALIDPHGDLAELVLGYIASADPEHSAKLLERLVLIEPAGNTCIGFNPLQLPKETEDQVFSRTLELVDIFNRFSDYGPETDELLRRSLLALVAAHLTLLELRPLLLNDGFRAKVVAQIMNREQREFWTQQFDRYSDNERLRVVRPLLRRLERFTMDPNIRAMLGQKKGISIRQLIDEGYYLLISLPKGLLKDCDLLASLFAAQFYWSALSRADTPPDKRKPYSLYLDEAQNFLGDGSYSEEVLSESRKYGLSLLCATQSLAFIPSEARASLLANCSTHVLFRLNPPDATGMSLEMSPSSRSRHVERLLNLRPREAYISVRGEIPPTRLRSLDVTIHPSASRIASLRESLHSRWGSNRKEIEHEIEQRHKSWGILTERSKNDGNTNGQDTEQAQSIVRISTTTHAGQFAPRKRT